MCHISIVGNNDTEDLKGGTGDINKHWEIIKFTTTTAMEKSGLQNQRKRRRLKIWNEAFEEAIRSKKETYLRFVGEKRKTILNTKIK
jgi:hypothetical protein